MTKKTIIAELLKTLRTAHDKDETLKFGSFVLDCLHTKNFDPMKFNKRNLLVLKDMLNK